MKTNVTTAKKILTLALLLVMLTTAFAGCKRGEFKKVKVNSGSDISDIQSGGESSGSGGSEADGQSSGKTETAGSGQKTQSSKGGGAGASSKQDAKDPRVAEYKPKFKSGEKITIMRDWGAYPSGQNKAWDNWNKRVAELERKYNIDIVEQKWNVTLTQESLSGAKPAGSLYQVTAENVWSLVNAGYIADWNGAMQATGITMTSDIYHPFNVQMSNLNNKQYAVGVEEARIGTGILFNKKLVDEFGDVYSLLESKQWTWGKLTEIANKVKAKYPAKHAIGMRWTAASALAISNGTSLVAIDGSGKSVSNLNSEAVREALRQIEDWCKANLVTCNWGQLGYNALDGEFANGNIAFLFCEENSLAAAYDKMGENDYGFAYLPMGPRMKEYRAHMTPAFPYVLPNAYKDRAADYLFLLNELYQLHDGYTKDTQFKDLWIRKFKSAKAYNTYKNMNRSLTFGFESPAMLGSDSNPWNSVMGKLFNGQITPGVLADTYHTEYSNTLKDRWSNIRFTGNLK